MQNGTGFRGGIDRGRLTVVMAGLAIGVLLIRYDSRVEPHIAAFGRIGYVDAIEDVWKELGATLGITLFLLAGASSLRRDRGRALAIFATCVIASGAIGQAAKFLIGRARPNYIHDQTLFFGVFSSQHPLHGIQVDSMPSGHTTVAFAMAAALTWRWPRLALLWFSLAVGVGASRTLAEMHFPSDVIIGACLGSVIGWVICARASVVGVGPLGTGHQGGSEGLAKGGKPEDICNEEEAN